MNSKKVMLRYVTGDDCDWSNIFSQWNSPVETTDVKSGSSDTHHAREHFRLRTSKSNLKANVSHLL